MKRLLFTIALMLAIGCNNEYVPNQNASASQNVPLEKTDGVEVEPTKGEAEPAADNEVVVQKLNEDGSYSSIYLVKHGKKIKTTWRGKVSAILDGRTIEVLNDAKERVAIRLDSVDTPEQDQPFGNAAKEYLTRVVMGRIVIICETDNDQDQQTLAFVQMPLDIFCAEIDLSETLVDGGLAWECPQFSKSNTLAGMEEKARREKRGLWAATR